MKILSLAQNKKVMEKRKFHNGHEYVDLGLPSGTLWATKNINAANEVDFGSQFAWGEIEGHSTSHHFNLFDYMRNDGETKDFLTKNWDAAHKIMGGCWRIPSSKQFNELIKYTNYKFCKSNNSVVLVSKINGNEIKFPHDFTCDVRYNGYRTSESLNAFVLDFGRLHSDFGFDYLTKNHNGYCVCGVVSKNLLGAKESEETKEYVNDKQKLVTNVINFFNKYNLPNETKIAIIKNIDALKE